MCFMVVGTRNLKDLEWFLGPEILKRGFSGSATFHEAFPASALRSELVVPVRGFPSFDRL